MKKLVFSKKNFPIIDRFDHYKLFLRLHIENSYQLDDLVICSELLLFSNIFINLKRDIVLRVHKS